MLDGWYCRSMANAASLAEEEERSQEESKFKKEYKFLKRKFHNLVYENEALMQALRAAQKRLLSVTRDRTFLLDRLLLHEKVDNSTSESEETDSSDDGEPLKVEPPAKKRKLENSFNNGPGKVLPTVKKKRNPAPRPAKAIPHHTLVHMPGGSTGNILSDGHMTPEEVERHLQAQNYVELVPERAPPTVPTEMFSNEPSLDSESNDIGELETSPSNMGEELSIDMIPE
ncbi:uncharacterized protein LOC662055 [Tribolium castaneum]|uniref:INO80 complex subunit E N-terminal domain-containing protein n=1 Tax=Tribolium castaneum TaxID=7070 RepID=D6WSG1_TRICA|nr:PREDICTED: uncharacterized protein LOC662055 [Tribolium castaneum]EFA06373.1 hypothetical protein TcasGA2_TC009249 [Tribolium castaneum]|eukprot:XP_976408.1 PREDICTED: uncharacterized protein LOC662055 [Tribolium castaneum]